ncbi:MAG: hypothetical protein R2867_06250 [Caldilineaceae bacterium]
MSSCIATTTERTDGNLVLDQDGQPWLVFLVLLSGIKLRKIDATTGRPATDDDMPIRWHNALPMVQSRRPLLLSTMVYTTSLSRLTRKRRAQIARTMCAPVGPQQSPVHIATEMEDRC